MAEKTGSAQALRRLAAIELFSSTRHSLGIYRGVVVSCRYESSSPDLALTEQNLYPALRKVIASQPMLRVGILAGDTNEAQFCHIPEIDLRNHAVFAKSDAETPAQFHAQLEEQQGLLHDYSWKDLSTRPPWRVHVMTPSDPARGHASNCIQHVFLVFYHALMDGTSGKMFHELILTELNKNPDQTASADNTALEPSPLLQFKDAPILPEPQDVAVPFKNSVGYLVGTLWNELGPPMLRAKKFSCWGSKPIDLTLPYVTMLKSVDFSAEAVAKLLAACREHSTSITGILQALTLASFASRLPASEAATLGASTPISLRPFIGPKANQDLKNSLRILVTGFEHHFTEKDVAQFRDSAADLDATIWTMATRIKTELNKRAETMPNDDISGLMKYNSDWLGFWEKKDGKPRPASWEISNIGSLKALAPADSSPRFNITRIFFSNAANAVGSPISIGVASITGGALTMGFSWQKSVVTSEFMDGVSGDVRDFVERFHSTSRFSK